MIRNFKLSIVDWERESESFADGMFDNYTRAVWKNLEELIGVINFSFGCADPKYPTVFGKVSAVRDWLKEVAGV